ncbi:MAG: oligosaccharide flippase family protein [Solobacterium sp.]|nr:oligosaccharide flippase family protein [Solobacterium sp.]
MTESGKKRIKQSFIMGSLTSSAGIFIAKALGLLYVVPFTSLATENNMIFYSSAYTFYSVLLQICTAGLPYATAAIVAKYADRDDWKSVILVRKLSTAILCLSGFIMAVFFMLMSGPLASRVLGASATAADIDTMKKTFIILALALFIVPLLSSYRGFYQGLKDLKVYASTQVLEQLARVIFLLGMGWITVRLLKMDNIWAVYMAVLSTGFGALIGVLYYVHYDKRHYGPIARSARAQETDAVDRNTLILEIFAFGLPYLLSTIFGNSQTIINTRFFVPVTTSLGLNYDTAKLLSGIIQVQCDKLTSIPQVLGIGFSAGIVPYMTIALENNNLVELRKNITDCLGTVLFIAVPVCFCMSVLARPVYYVMYGGRNLDYGEICLMYAGLLALVTTITPICSSMMMTIRLRKESIVYLCVGFIVKCVSFYPLIRYFGYIGAILSSVLCSATIIFLDLSKIKNKFDVTYGGVWVRLFKMIIACICMNAVFAVFKLIGFQISETSRVVALGQLAVYGICGVLMYLYVSSLMKLPQAIFGKSMKEILQAVFGRFLRRGKR